MRLLPALVLAAAAARRSSASIGGCDAPKNAAGCACNWGRDETGPDTFRGLSHPPDYTSAEIAATGLDPAVLKAADSSAAACELVCCQAKAITDSPAAEQAPAQTGPCGTWQFLAPPTGTGCWLGLDPVKRPLPKAPTAGAIWAGGAINQGPGSDWGIALIATLFVATVVYVSGGVAYNVKSKGMAPGLGALPHRDRWVELGGYVVDGVVFTRAIVQAKIQGGPMPAAVSAGGGTEETGLLSGDDDQEQAGDGKTAAKSTYGAAEETAAVPAAAVAAAAAAGDDSSDDDDDLVE
jgi:hypothetical protein